MQCDRIFPRSGRRCTKQATAVILVEMTGEEVYVCEDCARVYENEGPITYAPKDGNRWT